MLYNVLPPIVFFISLGGIILVMSRVVLRVRHDQYTADIKSQMAAAGRSKLRKEDVVTKVLKPSQKSVQVIRNRVALFRNNIGKSYSTARQQIADRRARVRQRQSESKATAASNAREPIAPSSPDQIQQPKTPLLQRISSTSSAISGSAASALRSGADKARQAGRAGLSQAGKVRARRRQPEDASVTITSPAVRPPAKPGTTLRIIENQESAAPDETATPDPKQNEPKAEPIRHLGLRQRLGKKKSDTVLEQAKEAIADAQHNQAESLLVPYIMEHPKDAQAYVLLGQAALGREAWQEAVEAFEQVIRINPDTPKCYAQLGHATLKAGKFTKAIEALQRAHNADPTDIRVIKDLLTIARRMNIVPMQQSLTAELAQLKQKK